MKHADYPPIPSYSGLLKVESESSFEAKYYDKVLGYILLVACE